MRINAGKYKRHNILMTNLDTTRETSDKVRQAIFNLIGQYFDTEVVLDLFAGSGAMGLEAISRGASKAYFNDINKKAINVVSKNIKLLKIDKPCVLYNLNYVDCLKSVSEGLDIIFLDPPYALNNIKEILDNISNFSSLKASGILAFEMAKTTATITTKNFEIIKEKIYGIKKVIIYKKR